LLLLSSLLLSLLPGKFLLSLELGSFPLLSLLLFLGLLNSNDTLNMDLDNLGDGSPDLFSDGNVVLNKDLLEVGINLSSGIALVLNDVPELLDDLVQDELRDLLLLENSEDLGKGVGFLQELSDLTLDLNQLLGIGGSLCLGLLDDLEVMNDGVLNGADDGVRSNMELLKDVLELGLNHMLRELGITDDIPHLLKDLVDNVLVDIKFDQNFSDLDKSVGSLQESTDLKLDGGQFSLPLLLSSLGGSNSSESLSLGLSFSGFLFLSSLDGSGMGFSCLELSSFSAQLFGKFFLPSLLLEPLLPGLFLSLPFSLSLFGQLPGLLGGKSPGFLLLSLLLSEGSSSSLLSLLLESKSPSFFSPNMYDLFILDDQLLDLGDLGLDDGGDGSLRLKHAQELPQDGDSALVASMVVVEEV